MLPEKKAIRNQVVFKLKQPYRCGPSTQNQRIDSSAGLQERTEDKPQRQYSVPLDGMYHHAQLTIFFWRNNSFGQTQTVILLYLSACW